MLKIILLLCKVSTVNHLLSNFDGFLIGGKNKDSGINLLFTKTWFLFTKMTVYVIFKIFKKMRIQFLLAFF